MGRWNASQPKGWPSSYLPVGKSLVVGRWNKRQERPRTWTPYVTVHRLGRHSFRWRLVDQRGRVTDYSKYGNATTLNGAVAAAKRARWP